LLVLAPSRIVDVDNAGVAGIVVHVLDADLCDLWCFVVAVEVRVEVLAHDLRQVVPHLDLRDIDAQHCSSMCPGLGRIPVADERPLWRPNHVNDLCHVDELSLLTVTIAICYLCAMFVPIAMLLTVVLGIELARWCWRPAARRQRALRRLRRSR
jgi:hypothetical protein